MCISIYTCIYLSLYIYIYELGSPPYVSVCDICLPVDLDASAQIYRHARACLQRHLVDAPKTAHMNYKVPNSIFYHPRVIMSLPSGNLTSLLKMAIESHGEFRSYVTNHQKLTN